MTYCVGLLLNDGLVFASDCRTNAGIDNIATYRKMKVFAKDGDRTLVFLSAGNLAVTQAALSLLEEGTRGKKAGNILKAPTMFQVARLAGEAFREVHRIDAEHLKKHNYDFNATLLLGGQIKGEAPRLFQIYAAGNFIEAMPDTPYFQIGETKYGKPVFDRLLKQSMSLAEAAKLTLISFDSTIRSNLSVGLPIDMMCYRRDTLVPGYQERFTEGHPYLAEIRRRWGEALRRSFEDIAPLPMNEAIPELESVR
ncbi:proteasome-type protease [Azospirillum sp.]|uniref:proteasome-type protease n=1 Tax=Azospirillum sp. TaxID=34012 RepID=UPI002D5967A8|nr:proteasome-type protease [Azospirillum sp.]HYD69664.1 proteasome-type protease [Azospirillum sp.]